MQKTLLIIDDDTKLLGLLTQYLGQNGYKTLTASSPSSGLALFDNEIPDLVIVDVMLPEMNGFELLKTLRSKGDTPVIMLTARGDVNDRIIGLGFGADDYLAKPFDPRELLARIESVLRRVVTKTKGKLQFDGLTIDLDHRTAHLHDAPLDLSTAEFEVLTVLAKTPGKKFTRDQLTAELHGSDWASFQRSIDVLISRLRAKLGDDPKQPKYIQTVWGTGYVFVAKR